MRDPGWNPCKKMLLQRHIQTEYIIHMIGLWVFDSKSCRCYVVLANRSYLIYFEIPIDDFLITIDVRTSLSTPPLISQGLKLIIE